jgi:hypothetical protein
MGLACLKGTSWQSRDPVCLWIPGLTGLGGHSLAEQRLWVCGSPAWQALEAQACRVNIVQGCVGLLGLAQQNGNCACLYLQCSRPWGHDWQSRDVQGWEHIPAKWSSCRAVQVLGTRPGRDHAGLCGPGGGHDLAEIVNVCGFLALRAHPTEILLL